MMTGAIRTIDIVGRRRTPLELSMRNSPFGGTVRSPPVERPAGLLGRARRLLLLIHGFNVTLCAAGCSYDKFQANLSLAWNSRSMSVYWPGDAETGAQGFLGRILSRSRSVASYPAQIERAKQSARVLAKYIAKARPQVGGTPKPPLELSIVAHSLGCRLALQLLQQLQMLQAANILSIRLVVLMAAAVPVYLLRPNRELRDGLEASDRVLVYYSAEDKVLSTAFRPGQSVEVPFPYGWVAKERHALGRFGLSRDVPRNVEQIQTNHDHGGYWPDDEIAQRVAMELDDGIVKGDLFRPLQLRRLPAKRTIILRDLTRRSLGSTAVGLRAKCGAC